MRKNEKNRSKKYKRKGFTLIEVLAVVTILGVLVVVGVISYNTITENTKLKNALNSAKSYIRGIEYNITNDEDTLIQMMINNKKLEDVLDSGDYPDDGAIVMYKNKVGQAKLCYNDEISIEYFLGEYTVHKNDNYCHYIEDAEEGKTGDHINTKNLDENTKIAGLNYEVESLDQEGESLGFEMGGVLVNSSEAKQIKSKLAKKVTNTNSNTEKTPQVKKLNNNLPSKFDLNAQGYITSVKDQGSLGTCWTYSGIGAIESRILVDQGITTDLSERQIDYFSLVNGINGIETNRYYLASSSGERESSNDGGNNVTLAQTLFNGLSVQTESNFPDDYKTDKKDASKVYDTNAIQYYVSKATLHDYMNTAVKIYLNDRSELETTINKIKESVYNKTPVAMGYCSGAYLRNLTYNGQSARLVSTNIYNNGLLTCGGHAGIIVGWDDDLAGGVWIVKNSAGSNSPYVYVTYDHAQTYIRPMVTIEKVEEKNWDNSYDTYNNVKDVYITNEEGNKVIADNAFYFDKANGSKEEIVKIGYFNNSDEEIGYAMELIDVKDEAECSMYAQDLSLLSENEDVKYCSVFSEGEEIPNYGYNIENFDCYYHYSHKVFENDICAVSYTLDKLNGDMVSLFTKDVDSTKKAESKVISSEKGKYQIDTVVANIASGTKVDYKIYNKDLKDVTSKYKIKDNVVVNNVAHSTLELNANEEYVIKTFIDGVEYGSLTVGRAVNVTDNEKPKCNWTSRIGTIKPGKTVTAELTCTDNYKLATTTLKTSDFGVSCPLKVKVSKVTRKSISKDQKTVKWTVSLTGKSFITSGNCSLTFHKNSVYDSLKNGNEVPVKPTISYKK